MVDIRPTFSLFLSFSLNTDEHLVDQCAFAVCYSSTVPVFLKLGEWQHNHETRGRIRDEILMHQTNKYKERELIALSVWRPCSG